DVLPLSAALRKAPTASGSCWLAAYARPRRAAPRRDAADATLQNLIAVATSAGAISGVPLTSLGLSGSVGSAAMRSQSTRSADCARAGELRGAGGGASKPMPKVHAIETAPNRFIVIPS